MSKFRNFNGSDQACDSLYDDPDYESPFMIETKNGERFLVILCWEQGRAGNYRFIKGSSSIGYSLSDIIWPFSVVKVEKK